MTQPLLHEQLRDMGVDISTGQIDALLTRGSEVFIDEANAVLRTGLQQNIALQSLHEVIDTSTPTDKLTFHLFGALAEFERHLIQGRTQAGLKAVRARGRLGGRPKALDADKRQLAIDLYNEGKTPVKKICTMMSISTPTLYAYIRQSQQSAKPDK